MTYHPFGTMQTNKLNHLAIGGVDTIDLVTEYQTPLIVYDVKLMRDRIADFKQVFERDALAYKISYASKAFAIKAMFRLLKEENIGCDVVSGGEMYTAFQAGYTMSKVAFHGNNKSRAELEMAVDYHIGTIVLDNFHEIELLSTILNEKGTTINVLLRIAPGVQAHTHDYISTGQEDSKFGFDLKSGQVDKAFDQVSQNHNMTLIGIHCHIGSQIFDTTGFELAVDTMVSLIKKWYDEKKYEIAVLNMGGGFGIRYTEEDQPLAPKMYVEDIVTEVKKQVQLKQIRMPAIWIEPGRSIVGEAGTTLYTIGSEKTIPDIRTYLAVDGGMGDNIRPALYQAKYTGVLANKADEEPTEMVSIAGKYCESGDMLIWDLPIAKHKLGDILAVFTTGAYGYSMASNYNRNPKPAVVFVEDGKSELVVRRESYEDLIQNDL